MSKRALGATQAASPAGAVSPAERRARFWRAGLRILLVAMIVLATLQWLISILDILSASTTGFDFSIYYAASLALRANPHANIFDLHLLQSVAQASGAARPIAIYTYPPLLAVLMLPLTLIPYRAALTIWTVLNCAAWLICALLLLSWFRRACAYGMAAFRGTSGGASGASGDNTERQPAAPLDMPRLFTVAIAVFLTLSYQPIEQSLMLGQVSLFILLLLLLVPWLIERDQPYLAGGLLALAVWIKLFPALLIVYFLLRMRWRVVGGAVAGLLLLALAQVPVIGVEGLLATRHVLDNGAFQSAQFHNEALARVPLWIAAEFGGHLTPALTLAGDALVGVVAVLFLVGLFRLRRSDAASDMPVDAQNPAAANRELLGYVWALCAMVLVAPITWEHYDAWLLPAMIVCLGLVLHACAAGFRDAEGRIRREVFVLAAIVVAYVITMHHLPLGYDGTTTFEIGPYIGGHPLRPFFMVLRPLGALLAGAGSSLLLFELGLRRPHAASAPAKVAGESSSRSLMLSVQARVVGGLLAAVCVMQVILIYVITVYGPYQPK